MFVLDNVILSYAFFPMSYLKQKILNIWEMTIKFQNVSKIRMKYFITFSFTKIHLTWQSTCWESKQNMFRVRQNMLRNQVEISFLWWWDFALLSFERSKDEGARHIFKIMKRKWPTFNFNFFPREICSTFVSAAN